ncbi:MAG TPA: C-GCAxxG-C-C family protein, partial [Spirochaetota bacterium]
KATSNFDEGYACSQALLCAFSGECGIDEMTAKRISSVFGGGMGRLREKCGAVTGAFMVLGFLYGNTDPKDMEKKLSSYEKVRDLNGKFEQMHGTTMCAELLRKRASADEVAERKHHKIICRKAVGDAAAILYDMIHAES